MKFNRVKALVSGAAGVLSMAWAHMALAAGSVIDTVIAPEKEAFVGMATEDLAMAIGIIAVCVAIYFAITTQWMYSLATVVVAAMCYGAIQAFA